MAGAADIRAGRAYIDLYTRDSLLRKGLDNAQKQLRDFGTAVRALGYYLIKLGAAATAPLMLVMGPARNLQTVMSKFNVVFGENAVAAKVWGDTFAGQIGRSRRQIAEFLADSQDLFVPLGFAAGAAMDMSKAVTELAVDLGALNRSVTDEDAMRDLHAALTGSGEVMKKYGVIVSEAAVKQNLLNQGLKPEAATEQQKVMARLNIILAGTKAAQGQATRTSGDFTEALKRLSAQAENARTAFGSPFLAPLARLTDMVSSLMEWMSKWADSHQNLIGLAGKLAMGITASGVALVALGAALSAAQAIMVLFLVTTAKLSIALLIYNARVKIGLTYTLLYSKALWALSWALKAYSIALHVVGAALWALVANPIGATIAALVVVVGAAVAVFSLLVAKSEKLSSAMAGAGEKISAAFGRLGDSLAYVASQFGDVAVAAIDLFVELAETSGAIDVLIFGLQALADYITSIIDGVRILIDALKEAQKAAVRLSYYLGLIDDIELKATIERIDATGTKETPGTPAATTTPATPEETAAKAKATQAEMFAEQQEYERRLTQAKIAAIANQFDQEKARIEEQYGYERAEMAKTMLKGETTRAAMHAQDKARVVELEALEARRQRAVHDAQVTSNAHMAGIRKTQQDRDRQIRQQERDQRQAAAAQQKQQSTTATAAVEEDIARTQIDLQFEGKRRELENWKRDYQNAMKEAKAAGVDPRLINQQFDLKRQQIERSGAGTAMQTANAGTFKGSEVSGLGAKTPAERTAKAVEKLLTATDRLLKIDENLLREQKRLTLEATA